MLCSIFPLSQVEQFRHFWCLPIPCVETRLVFPRYFCMDWYCFPNNAFIRTRQHISELLPILVTKQTWTGWECEAFSWDCPYSPASHRVCSQELKSQVSQWTWSFTGSLLVVTIEVSARHFSRPGVDVESKLGNLVQLNIEYQNTALGSDLAFLG